MKPILWCVKGPDGALYWSMMMPSRQIAIDRFAAFTSDTWKNLYRKGYRVVRVEVRELGW